MDDIIFLLSEFRKGCIRYGIDDSIENFVLFCFEFGFELTIQQAMQYNKPILVINNA